MKYLGNLIHRSKQVSKDTLRDATKWLNRFAPSVPPDYWSLKTNSSGNLSQYGADLYDLAQKFGTPLHVVQSKKLDENIEQFTRAPKGNQVDFQVYYSYKSNPVPGVLKYMHDKGIGAEVISPFELDLAFRLNVPAERIVYNGPAKSDESIALAISKEIRCINANSLEELVRIGDIAQRLKKRPTVGLRVTTRSGWAGQFGLPVATGEAFQAFKEGLEIPGIRLVGLHAHRGNQIRTVGEIEQHVGEVLEFADELTNKLGIDVEVLNFGGSLACPSVAHTTNTMKGLNSSLLKRIPAPKYEECVSIREYVTCVVTEVEKHFSSVDAGSAPLVCFEPGRAMTANTQLLLTTVMTTKAALEDLTYGVLDAGINLAENVLGSYHQLFHVNKPEAAHSETYRLVGPICTPGDVLYHACSLPSLSPGDVLSIMDSGAYFVPFETMFSFPRSAIVMLTPSGPILLRRRETFIDMTHRDEF